MKLTKELLREMIKEEISNSNVLEEKIGFFSKMFGGAAKARGVDLPYKKFKSQAGYGHSTFDGEAQAVLSLMNKALKGKVEKDLIDVSGLKKVLPKIEQQAKFAEEFNAGRVKAESFKDVDVVTGALAKLAKGLVERPKGAMGTLMRINNVIEKALEEDSLDMGVKSADQIQMTIDGLT
mgnify:FL=1